MNGNKKDFCVFGLGVIGTTFAYALKEVRSDRLT